MTGMLPGTPANKRTGLTLVLLGLAVNSLGYMTSLLGKELFGFPILGVLGLIGVYMLYSKEV